MAKPDPRLDLLIYAHDGRGLGHVSRSIAVGAAVRRLFPQLKVMLLTGSRHTSDLIGAIPLDWFKLPSYTKRFVAGRTISTVGPTNLKNSYLAASRSRLIRSVLQEYRPRCVLVDHEARGKRDELLPALSNSRDTIWLLGMRGVVGRVDEVWAPDTVKVFRRHYTELLWYGDPDILGDAGLKRLAAIYETTPVPVGYVSRMLEMHCLGDQHPDLANQLAGTIAIPWQTGLAAGLFETIRQALSRIGDAHGRWQIFADHGAEVFEDLPFCDICKPGPRYLDALRQSRTALVYGGYNSVTDILVSRIPAVVLLRGFDDQEQQEHLKRLALNGLIVFEERRIDATSLKAALETQLQAGRPDFSSIQINGAENAARRIAELL